MEKRKKKKRSPYAIIGQHPSSHACTYRNGGVGILSILAFRDRTVKRNCSTSRFLVLCSLRSAGAGTYCTLACRVNTPTNTRSRAIFLEALAWFVFLRIVELRRKVYTRIRRYVMLMRLRCLIV